MDTESSLGVMKMFWNLIEVLLYNTVNVICATELHTL